MYFCDIEVITFRLFFLMFSLLSVCEQDYAKRFRAIFMKPCVIMDCCYVMNPLNFGIGLIQIG